MPQESVQTRTQKHNRAAISSGSNDGRTMLSTSKASARMEGVAVRLERLSIATKEREADDKIILSSGVESAGSDETSVLRKKNTQMLRKRERSFNIVYVGLALIGNIWSYGGKRRNSGKNSWCGLADPSRIGTAIR